MEINKAFGQVVREARKERKLSQEQLAELSGMHVNHISFIERAKTSPSLQAMQQISEALGIKLSAMLEAAENLANQA
ncbi:helix-turn-helix domain-containing protein [Comamonas jiangduensis]|uniref:helix-turn-helix domain-containing protein n=1 Tax=Comamonas jiangduensis TaxID=1194168 RepID=UPI003BF90DCE